MPVKTLAAACVGVITAVLPASAWGASMACSPRDDVLTQLSAKFKEAPVAIGLANNGGLLEVLSSVKGETWTIIVTMPNGTSCLVAAGEDWQAHEQPVEDQPS